MIGTNGSVDAIKIDTALNVAQGHFAKPNCTLLLTCITHKPSPTQTQSIESITQPVIKPPRISAEKNRQSIQSN